MIFFGIDPGTATTGYGVVELHGAKRYHTAHGVIRTPAGIPVAERFIMIHDSLKGLFRRYPPDLVAMEELFFSTNVKTAIAVAQAQGVILLTAAQERIKVAQFTPNQVKETVTQNGRATKTEVQAMVARLLALADVPADANFPGAPRQVEYREGIYVGYRHFSTVDVPVRYCFGHGLGYTAFEFGQVRLSADRVGAGEGVVATVPVTNVGERAGTTVVQIYVSDPVASVHRPSRELAGFARAHLEAGASAEVTIAIGSRAFQFWDAPTAEWQTEGGEFEVLAAASADDVRSRATLTVDSAFAPVSLPAPPGHVADDIRFAALLGRAVPRPADALPYHRTSTVGDLGQTWLGRVVQRGLLRSLMSRVGDTLASDPTLAVMLERAVQEMPLRSLVTMSDGAVGWRALDALLEVLRRQIAEVGNRLQKNIRAAPSFRDPFHRRDVRHIQALLQSG